MPQILIFPCSSCGASLSYEGGTERTITCPFCNSEVNIPEEIRAQYTSHLQIPVPDLSPGEMTNEVSPDKLAELNRLVLDGHKIAAIELYRQIYPVGLKEAKDAVEAIVSRTSYNNAASESRVIVKGVGWGDFGCILLIIGGIGFVLAMVFGLEIRLSGSYRQALYAAQTDPAVIEALGAPVKPSWLPILGQIRCSRGCSASYNIPIHGSRSRGYIYVHSDSEGGSLFRAGIWTLDATVNVHNGPSIELVPTPVPTSTLSAAQADATEGAIEQVTRRAQATRDSQSTATSQEATQTARARYFQEATATAGAQATAQAVIATQATWPALIIETFKDNHLGWPVGIHQDESIIVTTVISNGNYLWSVDPKHNNCYENMIPEKSEALTDFYTSVKVRLFEGGQGGNYAYGLVFRHLNDDYGFFGIQNDGHFRVLVVYHTGIYQHIIMRSSAIRTQLDQDNQITVRAIGSNFIYLINDQVVWELNEDMAPGSIGLGVDIISKVGEAQVEFTDYEVRAP
jgi:hypothetical protein